MLESDLMKFALVGCLLGFFLLVLLVLFSPVPFVISLDALPDGASRSKVFVQAIYYTVEGSVVSLRSCSDVSAYAPFHVPKEYEESSVLAEFKTSGDFIELISLVPTNVSGE
jgi:hypothetical protein